MGIIGSVPMTRDQIELAITQLRELRTPDHSTTRDEWPKNSALDLALFLLQRESAVDELLNQQYSHFFHPDVTTRDQVQEAAEEVRNFKCHD